MEDCPIIDSRCWNLIELIDVAHPFSAPDRSPGRQAGGQAEERGCQQKQRLPGKKGVEERVGIPD